jgi:ectoine hydroxylase
MALPSHVERAVRMKYGRDGWVALPDGLSDTEIGKLRERIQVLSTQRRPEVVHEAASSTVRAIHGCHAFDEVCDRLVRFPMLLDVAEALLCEPVYLYQFKVNIKAPMEGKAWPWHQDFAFWHREDGMAAPDAVTIAIFLDEVDERNGPLEVIPGTHHLGLLGSDENGSENTAGKGNWRSHVSADLEHTVPAELAAALAHDWGRHKFTGPAGTAVAFHPNLVHSSSDNQSAHRRSMLFLTYNKVTNAPLNPTRPEFLVNRDTRPVVRVAENRL